MASELAKNRKAKRRAMFWRQSLSRSAVEIATTKNSCSGSGIERIRYGFSELIDIARNVDVVMFLTDVSTANRCDASVNEICSPRGVTRRTEASILPASSAKSAAFNKSF